MKEERKIRLTSRILDIIAQTLPPHLWLGEFNDIYHIDALFREDQNRLPYSKISLQPTGWLFGCDRNLSIEQKDIIAIILYRSDQTSNFQSFYNFLKQVGGNVEEYKERIIFLTGQNPF